MNGRAWGFTQPWWHYAIGAGIMVGCAVAYHRLPLGHTWKWVLFGVILGTGTLLLQRDTQKVAAPRPATGGKRWAAWFGLHRDPVLEKEQWRRLKTAGQRVFVMRNGVFGVGIMSGLGVPMLSGSAAHHPFFEWGLELLVFMGGGYVWGLIFWRWIEWRFAHSSD